MFSILQRVSDAILSAVAIFLYKSLYIVYDITCVMLHEKLWCVSLASLRQTRVDRLLEVSLRNTAQEIFVISIVAKSALLIYEDIDRWRGYIFRLKQLQTAGTAFIV